MPKLQTISLHFPQGLHVGARAVSQEEAGVHIPSDTLFSALVDIWGRIGGQPDAWIRPFRNDDPPFLLTSAFPFAGKVRFYPAPVDLQLLISPDQPGATADKSLKRIRFLSEELLRRVIMRSLLHLCQTPAPGHDGPLHWAALTVLADLYNYASTFGEGVAWLAAAAVEAEVAHDTLHQVRVFLQVGAEGLALPTGTPAQA